ASSGIIQTPVFISFFLRFSDDASLFIQPVSTTYFCSKKLPQANVSCQNILHGERDILARLHLNNLPHFIIGLYIFILVVYLGTAGLIHNAFYVKKKDACALWKIQSKEFMAPDLVNEGILEVCKGFFNVSLVAGTLFCYILNQGPLSKVYFNLDGSQFWWTLIQGPVLLLWQDHEEYWRHRIFHSGWLFKKFHSVHHKYKHPTSFVTFAWHPFEITVFFLISMTPFFVVPVYFGWIVAISVFIIGHNMLDHSGINLKAPHWLPFLPDIVFHDRHHQRGNVNFGSHFWLCDFLFGTCEQVRS
ncbi:unnamed protein product, partial [Bemisia tabaci]